METKELEISEMETSGIKWEENSIRRVLGRVLTSRSTMRLDAATSCLLAGRPVPDDGPKQTSRLVRVFLCSTATDSCTERTAFMERVYPRLKEYCRHRYGLEFQTVDLAWGLSTDRLTQDQDLRSMKIQEILKCQNASTGPNFVAFIGQKYGPRPLPSTILAEEYEVIRVALHAHRSRDTRNAALLDQAYVIDTNSIPPVYVIRQPADITPELMHDDCNEHHPAEEQWEQLQDELCALLQKGAELAYLDGALDSDVRSRFFMSDLEKEVQLGIENCDNPHRRCVLVLRDIVDLKNYVDDPQAPLYSDLVVTDTGAGPEVQVDGEAESRLVRLKNRARGLISPSNSLQHEVLWRFDQVIHPTLHHEYLDKLCSQMYSILKRLVDESASDVDEAVPLPPVAHESMQHWARCRNVTSDFHVCQSQLQRLRDYITGFSDHPMILYGPPGCGKTKLVSKLALELSELVPGDMLSLIRYVGFTAKSWDVRQIVLGLCTQLSAALGLAADDIPDDFKELQRFFPELLNAVPSDVTVVIILDALDQLRPDYNAYLLSWLPLRLPAHVKLVMTLLPERHGLLPRLQDDLLKAQPSAFLHIQPLSLPDSQSLLTHFLAASRRQISEQQMASFSDRLLAYSLPLYVKLIAEEARTLTSFTPASQLHLPTDCTEGIERLFDRLEAKHGHPVVSRAMAYTVASVTGLSDVEMEDLLSLDDVVLNHIYKDHHPPLRRVPFAVWLKMRSEVEAFLTVREVDGVTVTVWEHDLFVQTIRRRYLQSPDDVTAVHSMLADYFLGTWAATPKPVQLEEGVVEFPPCGAQADRLVPPQPLTFPAYVEGEEVKFNKRMYDQVPRHLDLSGRHKELKTLVLFNYEWLYNKMKALSLQHVLADFALNSGEEATLVQEALRGAASTIEKDIGNLPAEITGRLLPYYLTHPCIRALIDSCDVDGLKHCGLLPNFPYQQVPGSSLQFTLDCPAPTQYLGLVYGDRYLLCKETENSHVHVFDLLTGELKDTIFASNGELYVTPNGRHFVIIDHVTEKSFKIHDSGTGDFLGQIILLRHIEIRTDKYHAGPISLTDDRLCAVVETSDTSFLFISEIPSGNMLQIVSLDGKASVCRVTPSGKHVLCNSNEFLLVYDLYAATHTATVPVTHKPSAIAFTADGLRAFLATPLDDHLVILHLNSGAVDLSYKAALGDCLQGDEVRALSVAPSDQLVLVRSDNHLIVHQRAQEQVVAHFVRPQEIPKEFRLPKSHYKELVFTSADFTRDSACIIATIFRNIYIWQIKSGKLLTSIQAPIGIIKSLLVCKERGQVITHTGGSRHIHVWKPDTAGHSVDPLDKMTAPVQRVLVTKDSALAFVQCLNSDEIGVIDMKTGGLMDLLTHDNKVEDMAITPSGHMALVVTQPRLSGTAVRLWDLMERRVVQEMGDTPGRCLSLHSANTIVYFSQAAASLHAPYDVSLIHFIGDTHTVHNNPGVCKYVRARPVATYDDRFIVVSSALGHDDRTGRFQSPCLVVFDTAASMKRTCYDAKSVGLDRSMVDVLSVQPCPNSTSSVAVVVSCRVAEEGEEEAEEEEGEEAEEEEGGGVVVNGDVDVQGLNGEVDAQQDSSPSPRRRQRRRRQRTAGDDAKEEKEKEKELQIGFFVLDLGKGCISAMNFLQPAPGSAFPPALAFSSDCTVCIDGGSTVYNLTENTAIDGHLPLRPPGAEPQCLALHGSAVVYYQGSQITVLRLADGSLLGRCEVHAPICYLRLCSDERTLLVGCRDGRLASYVLVDPLWDRSPKHVVRSIKSRRPEGEEADETDGRLSRSWDKVETSSAPAYSRPPSALSPGTKDRLILRQIKPVQRFRPKSDTLLYLNAKTSRACSVM